MVSSLSQVIREAPCLCSQANPTRGARFVSHIGETMRSIGDDPISHDEPVIRQNRYPLWYSFKPEVINNIGTKTILVGKLPTNEILSSRGLRPEVRRSALLHVLLLITYSAVYLPATQCIIQSEYDQKYTSCNQNRSIFKCRNQWRGKETVLLYWSLRRMSQKRASNCMKGSSLWESKWRQRERVEVVSELCWSPHVPTINLSPCFYLNKLQWGTFKWEKVTSSKLYCITTIIYAFLRLLLDWVVARKHFSSVSNRCWPDYNQFANLGLDTWYWQLL